MNPVAPNAKKHGILSEMPVIDKYETLEDWLAHRTRFWEDLRPRGAVEETLVEQLALTFWRKARLARAEVAAASRRCAEEVESASLVRRPDTGALFPLKEAQDELQLLDLTYDWLAAFESHPENDTLSPAIWRTVNSYLIAVFESELERREEVVCHDGEAALGAGIELFEDPEREFELARRTAGVPAASEAGTVGSQRLVILHVALRLRVAPDRVVQDLIKFVRDDLFALSRAVRDAERQVELVRASCQLPLQDDLQLYTRYDAHLGRELSRLFKMLRDLRTFGEAAALDDPVDSATPVRTAPAPSTLPSPLSTHSPITPVRSSSSHSNWVTAKAPLLYTPRSCLAQAGSSMALAARNENSVEGIGTSIASSTAMLTTDLSLPRIVSQ